MVGHLDADCFYVSAERVRHPDLVGKPVGMLGNNGACVIAKSYEMRAAGVKTGMWAWSVRHLERLIEELRYHRVRTDRIGVQVAYQDGSSGGGLEHLGHPTDRFDLLADGLRAALRSAWYDGAVATHMWVSADRLVRARGVQLSLFDPPDPQREAVADVKAAVNGRFGRFTLRSAATLYLPAVYADPANAYDVCDVRGKFCF